MANATLRGHIRMARFDHWPDGRRPDGFQQFYDSLAMLFFGAYMGRYRLEMALAFPFVAVVMAAYFALAFKPDSAAQRPMGLLLFADFPELHQMFPPTRVY